MTRFAEIFRRSWRKSAKVVTFTLFCLSANSLSLVAQDLFINEIQSSNLSTLYDHTGDTPDWLEIYNDGNSAINLEGYGLSDRDSIPLRWTFPAVEIASKGFLLVHASGLNLKEPVLFWETIIDLGDSWSYNVPTNELPTGWNNTGFDDMSWSTGKSGFGYGDGDDSTVINNTMSVFLRKKFSIENKEDIVEGYLHMDYDDAFVAYLNGVEIARANIGQHGIRPAFDAGADDYDHEALLYRGEDLEAFAIDQITELLVVGENVLAIQVHNHSLTSSDLTAIPILSLGGTSASNGESRISEYINFVPKGLHANFKISSAGEHLILSDPNGIQIDSVYSGSIKPDVSLGRQPDGSATFRMFGEPTPGTANDSEGFSPIPVGEVQFSMSGGYYSSGFSLELSSADSNDSIYYTRDGSSPDSSHLLYSGPISIFSSQVVRARIIKQDHLPGNIATQTFVIGRSHQLPIVCVNTDPDNLWDYESGIYVKGPNAQPDFPYFDANFWQDWERPANIAMYEVDGELAFQLDAGIKIFGAWSKGHDQKSLSIHTRKSMGTSVINYKLFDDLEINEFKTFILRNSGNDWNNTMLRDAFANRVTSSLGIEQQAYRPAVVYLNGEYWGIHNIREKVNEEFISSHYGIDEDDIDILEKNAEVVRGNSEHYEALRSYMSSRSLANKDTYAYVQTQMDVENFMRYHVAQIFIDNRDWPGNNIKFWRERTNYGKWRWIMFDSDFAFNTWGNDNQNFNTLKFALDPNGPGWPNPPWSTFMFRKLMENESFKHDFINCFADNLNTIFVPNVLQQKLDEMKAVIQPEIKDHFSRWRGDIGYWNQRINAMETFVGQRQSKVRNHIQSEFRLPGMFKLDLNVEGDGSIELNTLHLNDFPWTGQYYQEIPVEMDPVPAPGFRFVEWRGVETNGQEHLSIHSENILSLTAVFEPWTAAPDAIVINEINYNSSETFDAGDWVELLNVTDRSINLSGWEIEDQNAENAFIIPEGTIIKPHELIVICRNRVKFLTHFPGVQLVPAELEFGFSSSGDCVRLLNDEGALMDEVCYENSSPWPDNANGLGPTLSLIDAFSNNAHPANWTASTQHGTPGKKNTDVITDLPDELLVADEIAVNVYPNPFQNSTTIQVSNLETREATVRLTDISGRLKYAKEIKSKDNLNRSHELTISKTSLNLAAGIYIVHVAAGEYTEQIKIVLQ